MDKRTLVALIAIIAMLLATAAALKFGVDVTLQDQPGVYMRMPAVVDGWRGQQLLYCHSATCRWGGIADDAPDDVCPRCGADLFAMAAVEKDQLPADTEFLKYLYTRPAGASMQVSIVLSGNARSSIHRPQRCLVAQGFNITTSVKHTIAMPGRNPLRVKILDTLYRYGGPRSSRVEPMYYAYWFVGQNRETPSHLARMFWLAWDRIWHGVAHRWVYIIVQGQGYPSPEAFEQALQNFLPAWYPAVIRRVS